MAEQSRKFTLGATGDILLHDRLYNKAKTKDGGYDFSEMLAEAKPLFKKDHLTIVNQESIMGGKELGLSSHPKFNSPIEIGQLLKEFNVDIVNMANNHVTDKGIKGIFSAIHNLNTLNLPYVGAYKSLEDKNTLRIFHKNGLRICFLSYSRFFKAFKGVKHLDHYLGYYVKDNVVNICKLIEMIKRSNLADVVIISMHFGKEYQMLPIARQIEICNSLSDAGADVILGHHPHVLQPPAYIMNSRGHDTFCMYSLGNFFSGQHGIYRQIGGYMNIEVEKPSTKKYSLVKLSNTTIKLSFDDHVSRAYKLQLLEDVIEERKTIKTHMGEFDSKEIYDRVISHMRKWVPDLIVS